MVRGSVAASWFGWISGPSSPVWRALTALRYPILAHFAAAGIACGNVYCLASGAANTALQAAGSAAIVIGGLGLAGSFDGFGCSTESLNQ